MTIIGIDPGQNGALVNTTTKAYLLMPLESGRWVDVGEVQAWLIAQRPSRAYIERQQTRGGQGGQGIIMENFGRLTAVLDLMDIEFSVLDPKIWQKWVEASGDKDANVELARSLGAAIPWTSYRKDGKPTAKARLHDGVADAFLIGLAGKRIEDWRWGR